MVSGTFGAAGYRVQYGGNVVEYVVSPEGVAVQALRAVQAKDQRDEHIRRYAELIEVKPEAKPGQTVQVSGGRGNKSVAAEVAEQTGLSARTVRRALNPKLTK